MDTFLSSVYWGSALFFSVLFAWQLLATLFGHFGGGDQIDAGAHDAVGGHDVAGGHAGYEAAQAIESVATFKLLSVRSVTSFGLLFGWAGVLYQRAGVSQNLTILYSLLWGLVGMLIVSALFYFFMRMTESGTRRLSSAIGQPATVYMDIPAGGSGQVRVLCGGSISFISARAAGGEALKAGTPVVVRRIIGPNIVEVEKSQA
jgi:membrane protein implicated in regulation of membrane protease activity